ncbi:fungal-specific transcription factor domain-containing protein [Trametes elegans]|nr:fungal-specific transcription factor domain-containing protein [Trametes elegans]
MIGQIPSLFDPSMANPPEGLDYQQWVDSFSSGQQYPFAQAGMTGNVPQVPYQQSQLHQVQASTSPASASQVHYNFVPQDSFAPGDQSASFDSHFAQASMPDRPQRGLPRISRRGGAPVGYPSAPNLRIPEPPRGTYSQPRQSPHHSQQAFAVQGAAPPNDSYFYPPVGADVIAGSGSGDQQHLHSSYNFVPQYQPDQYSASGYTPNSDFTNLPSSVSTPSVGGTDDSQRAYSSASSHVSQHASSQQPQASSSRQPVGSARGRARGTKPAAKRARQEESQDGGDSDTQSEDEQGPTMAGLNMTVSVPPPQGQSSLPARLPGACKHCKKLKMRCEFPQDENTCKRCKSSGHQCIVEGRKPRNAPNKREYLLAQIRQKNAIIESLLKQIHNPYLATPMSIASYRMATSPTDQNNQNVIAFLDRLQASVQSAGSNAGLNAFRMDARADRNSDDSDEDTQHEPGAHEPTERGSPQADEDDEPLRDAEDQPQALPDQTVPIGLLAKLALDNNKKKPRRSSAKPKDNESSDDDVGVANVGFFEPGPAFNLGLRASMIESVSPPEILVHGLVTPDDVDKLFEIYFDKINVHCDVLDPALHTPATTFNRCPFLFTVICAISCRYYQEKSDIYPIAMHFAKHAAASALLNGWKSVELSQAYILMSLYGVPARRWEEDRNWLYTGLAIRIATDLNLHVVSTVKPKSERQEREMVNQSRVWLLCYNLDRSTATQFGKPATIKEDYTIRNCADWYKRSRMNSSFNIGTSAYAAMLRIMAHFHEEIYSDPDSPTGLNQALDFRSSIINHDEQLMAYFKEWSDRFQRDSDLNDPALKFRASLLPFLTGYSRLVMWSFGFQQAFKRGFQPDDQLFLEKCFESAKTIIVTLIDTLAPTGYMRTSPDAHFVFASFASAFLLKLLRPEFSTFVSLERQTEIFDLISRLIDKLRSPDIAIDERHTPALHSRFLHGLLRKHRHLANLRGSSSSSSVFHSQPAAPSTQGAPPPQYAPHAGGVYDGAAETSPASYTSSSESPTTFPTDSAMFEAEPSYTAGNGQGTFQFGAPQPEESWGPLVALQNPNYWNNMMMPGFSWPESPPHMQEHATNGFDTGFNAQYHMSAPIISG